jgi:hypothetical protein
MTYLTWYETNIIRLIETDGMTFEQLSMESEVSIDYIKEVYYLAKRKEKNGKKKTNKS